MSNLFKIKYLNKNIKDIYNFKKYYLINKEWLKEYKEFFLYDFVEKKIESEYKNKNYSYNRIKHSLNNIVKKKLGQIRLFSETILSDFIRNAKNLKYHNKDKLIHIENNENNETPDGNQINGNKQKFIIPFKYELLNEDLYRLLIKEEFFYNLDDKIGDIISFDVLIGNSQIIIKNKATEENEEKFKYSNEYLIYDLKNKNEENNIKDYKNKDNKEQNKENGDEDKFILKYILNYDDDNIFYKDLDKIMKEGLNSYFNYRKLDKDIKINHGILIKDDKDKYIGKFINIDLNEEDIKNDFGIKINEQNKENHIDSIEINSNKIKTIFENKEAQPIFNENIEDNHIIENNDIKCKNNNEIKENKVNKNIYEKMIAKYNKERNEKNKEENQNKGKTIYNNDNKINEHNEKNDNINEINNELNRNKSNEDKDNVINAINEDNKNENNIDKEEKIEYIKNQKCIDEIKQRKIIIEKSFKDLCKNIIKNEELNDLNINVIMSKDFPKNENHPDLKQIILIDEESSKQFQTFINYPKLNEIINIVGESKKDALIENFHEEFNNIDKILSGMIELPIEIKLIDGFQKCKNNMDNKKKFQLFEKNKFIEIFKKGENIFIYYFTYKNNSFIFFPKDKKILKLKFDNDFIADDLFYLEEYIDNLENKKDIEESFLKKIILENQNKLKFNEKILKKEIKDYYLINRKWLNNRIKASNENNYEKIEPQLENKEFATFDYPKDFYFIEKEENNLILDILELGITKENKIFFTYDNVFKEEENRNIYIGLINNKDIEDSKILAIYFYSIKDKEFEIEYIVNYYYEERMLKEIKDNIMIKGIETYLNIMSNNNNENNNTEPISLYDIDLNNFGLYFNLNKKEINNIIFPENTKNIGYIPNKYFYCGIIQCLLNIKPLREIFLNKHLLITNNIIKNTLITKKIYQIFQNIWYGGNNNEIYASLIPDIIIEENNFKDYKLLLEFLLLYMHNEQTKEKKENYKKLDSLIYDNKDKMRNDFYSKQTFIQELFFFETKHHHCKYCKKKDYIDYRINCVLEFKLDRIKEEIITINNILESLKQKKECNKCNNTFKLKKKFNSCPLFLIIVIKHNNKFKDNFKHIEKIELNNYVTKDYHESKKYELISFINYPPIEEKKKKGIIFCKSPVNNEWYKYEGSKCEKTNIKDIIKEEKSIPNLLIYMNESAKNINIDQLFGNN